MTLSLNDDNMASFERLYTAFKTRFANYLDVIGYHSDDITCQKRPILCL